jgi:hypothetical protein
MGWTASLLAVDGSTTAEVPSQLQSLPANASHLVLSVGGNDAIMNASILQMPADSASMVLAALADVACRFERNYRRAVEACRLVNLPVILCTIYNGCFPDPQYQRTISTALIVFNYVILRVGIEFRLSIIDLRFVCSSPSDYANPIEPSSLGGAKIARAIVNLVTSSRSENNGAVIVTA